MKGKKNKGLECLCRSRIVCHKGRKLDDIIEFNECEDEKYED